MFAGIVLCVAMMAAQESQPPDSRGLDLYPQIYTIIRDAESASSAVRAFDDRSEPEAWAGHLFARAAYLKDAERSFSRTSLLPIPLLKAYVVYGNMAAADSMVAHIADPAKRGSAELVVADVLWRMGKPSEAQEYAQRAEKTAKLVADGTRRASLLQAALQQSQYMGDPAPNKLSPHPMPAIPMKAGHSPFPQFPITAGGFAGESPEQTEQNANANAHLLEDIYARLAANDLEGAQHILDSVTTPFQKTLAIAGIEHLLIQSNQPEEAEAEAAAIPETTGECVLAKAEAFSSAAAEWLRAGNVDRANEAFAKATRLVESGLARRLPIGEVTVLASIAEAQAAGGLSATSQETLEAAKQAALQLPLAVRSTSHVPHPRPTPHFRSEAYRAIFSVAIRAHDLGTARQTAELWRRSDKSSDYSIVQSWLQAGDPQEAISFAHGLPSAPERAETELSIAQQMLDQLGAPNI